ncbi:hypothetical protein J1N35_045751 [Gossypium stocksii]|uniref:RNase H type-1 domain-containing protein n=1 Tax=Gossypium stocksii TaxID=47602 RepID=A0A9D3ZHJ4_9ROSI|nr:hypothetical protein J1N35_045751 [Gossypium stocksii]
MENKARCGEVLRDVKGLTRSLFSGSIKTMGSKMAEVMAIKIILEMYIGMEWHVKVPLIIEFSSCVTMEWLLERNYRLWILWNLFISTDRCINQLILVHFAFVHWQCNDMIDALVKARVRRLLLFKA